MRSLQYRLSLGLLISLCVAFLALWLLVSSASRYLAEQYIVTRLMHDSESLLAILQHDATTNTIKLDTSRVNPVYTRPFSGHYYKIISDGTLVRSRSLWDQDLIVESQLSSNQQHQYITGPQQQPLIMFVSTFNKGGKSYTIAVAEDLSPINADLKRLQRYFVLAALLLLLLLIGIQVFILHIGLTPLNKTRTELSSLMQGKISQLDQNVPREITPLVKEINHLLAVLNKRLLRSRNALGDLAHALKKPLTALKQLTRDESLAKYPDLQQNIESQLDSMQRQVTRILQRARLAGEGPGGSFFKATEEIPPLLATLKNMYYSKSLVFDTDISSDITITADREDMLELIGNLLDNACKWASHRIRLSLQQNTAIHITIEDDGPGVDADKLESLTQRGLRLDEKIEGHGLGLSIANEIVASLGGQLHLQRSSLLGGMQVSITLPR